MRGSPLPAASQGPDADAVQASRDPEDAKILEAVQAHLTPEGSDALRALASTAVALDTTSTNPETLAHALIAHATMSQTLANNIAHVQTLQRYLDRQHILLRSHLNELQSNPAFSVPPSLQRQTTEQARQTKHLRTKIREYEDRLLSLEYQQAKSAATPASKGVSSAEAIADMLEQQTSLSALRQRVESLEKEVDEFAGLPADREAARKEVGKLEVELDNVRRRRDALFEGLVG
jgi:HAUS augmin-like complex subunit 1